MMGKTFHPSKVNSKDNFIASNKNNNTDVTISILWAITFLPEHQICKMFTKDEGLLNVVIR
jgi:hypothetical protein